MEEKAETVKLQHVEPSVNPPPMEDDYDDGYDPHDHRELYNATNNIETLVHLLKCSLGTGILAMPQAFAKAGLITGIVSTILVGILVTHCLHVLVRSQYAVCKQMQVPHVSYPAAVGVSLLSGPSFLHRHHKAAEIAVDTFLVVYQLGICCVYIVFIADNIKKVVDPYYQLSIEFHMFIILGPLIMFNLIPSLKLLAPFSAVANLMTFVGLGIIVSFLVTGKKSNDELDLWGSPEEFPLFFGTVLFALTAVGVVVALENNMKTPKAFGSPCGVLNTGMIIIVSLYVAVGALGYIFCVSECSDSITLDLPKDSSLATSVVVMFAIAIFTSYGLHCFVPVDVLWRRWFMHRLAESSYAIRSITKNALRVGLCLLTFVLAIAVPRLGLFISLFGALCLSALGICFPAVMEICLYYCEHHSATRTYLIVKDTILFMIGLVGLFAGTYTALISIIQSFQPDTEISHA